jgi:lipid-binding SYLF domain-containing protein
LSCWAAVRQDHDFEEADVKTSIVVGLLAISACSAVNADSLLEDVKKGVSGAVDTVVETAESVTKKESPEETRHKIDSMAKSTLSRLFAENSGAKQLYEQSYGHAVFDTRKFSFIITSGFGAGVAVDKANGKRAYMKMATGGVNVGLGGEFFQLVMLFENKRAFDEFVSEGFEAGSSASAVAGSDSAGVQARFVDGLAVYQLTEKGLKLAADITGTKYWKDDDLN